MTINAMSVDVEDYFHVSAFEDVISRLDWEGLEPRVHTNTRRLLRLFESRDVKATFFVLGWVVERWPGLIREIRDAGHELASHGYDHKRATTLTPEEFREDIRCSKALIEDIAGEPVLGYRAPSYSIVRENLWALDILSEEGFAYDSSIFPIRHDRYGIPDSPRFPWQRQEVAGAALYEFPISTVRVLGINLPFVGGGYLRQFPFSYVRWGMRRVNRREKRPVVVYVHPWEIDPDQPRQAVRRSTALRHYRNLHMTERRLSWLLDNYQFSTLSNVLGLGDLEAQPIE